MKPFGPSSFALSMLFSTLRQAPSQGRQYTSSYMKCIQHFTALIGAQPRLSPELYSSLKNLGIAKVKRGCRGGLKVKNRWINQDTNLNIPVRITNSSHGSAAKQCHQKLVKNSSIRDSNNLIMINLVSELSVEVPLRPRLHGTGWNFNRTKIKPVRAVYMEPSLFWTTASSVYTKICTANQ